MKDFKENAPFHLDFVLERKSVDDDEHGDTYIQGYASDFGLDRQDEAFEKGAFEKGMREYMKNPVMLFHHKHDEALGQVQEFENREDGLWIKAKLDKPEPGTKAADTISKVRSGTIRGFSVGGKFHRRKGSDGRARIHTADILEISVTPTPVNPRTLLEVATKAFPSEDEANDAAIKSLADKLTKLIDTFDDIEKRIDARGNNTNTSTETDD